MSRCYGTATRCCFLNCLQHQSTYHQWVRTALSVPSGTAIDGSDVVGALDRVSVPGFDSGSIREASVTRVDGGVNEVFVVSTDTHSCVVKFGTHSTAWHLCAGVVAARILSAHTDLPVAEVYAFEWDVYPPFVVMERLPGVALADDFYDPRTTQPDALRLLGTVIEAFSAIPEHVADGYGVIQRGENRDGDHIAVGEYDDCGAWLLDYASRFYQNPPEHEALSAIAPQVPEYLRAHREKLPTNPDPAIVVTDLSPGNLLAQNGTPPSDGGGLTGVVDLERAKIGPAPFTAVNAEYLLTRYVSEPETVRDALYEPLPFGPDMPSRELYRLIATSRSVAALSFWYEPGSEMYHQRGDAIAAEIERTIG